MIQTIRTKESYHQRIPKFSFSFSELVFHYMAENWTCDVQYSTQKKNKKIKRKKSKESKDPFGESLFFLLLLCFYVQVFLYSLHLLMFFLSFSLSKAAVYIAMIFWLPFFIAHCCIALNLHNMLNNINFLAFILN